MIQFLRTHRQQIIARTTAKFANFPEPSVRELEKETILFLEELTESLDRSQRPSERLRQSASRQGRHLQNVGVSLRQVVYVYGDICQAVTALASELNVAISVADYQLFNACLDQAVAEAVTEFARATENLEDRHERRGFLVHELRNSLSTALLAFDVLKRGQVGIGGSTGAVLHRSLMNLQALIERELTSVRIQLGQQHHQPIELAELIHELVTAAAVQAQALNLRLTVTPVDPALVVRADRHLLASALSNLLQNALKFSPAPAQVSVRVHATADRVHIEVEDACGGLPTGRIEELFRPFEQQGPDRSGLGLGLAISRKAIHASGGEIVVRNLPGKGCIFIIELPL